jgi:hypothetical protein
MWTTTNRLQLEVKEVNNIPTLAGATNASVSELVGYVQDLIPRDTDLPLQPLTVTLLSGPAGLVVTNSVLAWTPTAAQGPSTNLVVVAVSDGAVTLTNRFIITVRAAVDSDLVSLRLLGLNSDGRIELEARGPEGMKLSLEASDTLKTWVEVQLLTGRGNNTPVKVTLQPDPNVQTKFWRVLAR